jgi:hypothetical protein
MTTHIFARTRVRFAELSLIVSFLLAGGECGGRSAVNVVPLEDGVDQVFLSMICLIAGATLSIVVVRYPLWMIVTHRRHERPYGDLGMTARVQVAVVARRAPYGLPSGGAATGHLGLSLAS